MSRCCKRMRDLQKAFKYLCTQLPSVFNLKIILTYKVELYHVKSEIKKVFSIEVNSSYYKYKNRAY